MRSTDKTYYDIKRLHVVFAVSSVALLAVTVWMLAADHLREWKGYQRTFRDRIQPWMTGARIEQERSREFLARGEELLAALDEARRAVPEKELIETFGTKVKEDAARRNAEARDFAGVRKAYEALSARPGKAAREALLARLQEFLAAATLRQENAQRRLRFRRAELAEVRSYYEAGVGEDLPPRKLDKLQEKVDRTKQNLDRLAAELQRAAAHRQALKGILGEITRVEDAARTALADHRATLDRLDRTLRQQSPSLAKRLLRWPLIDALGRPLAVDQIWLPELTIDYNFRRVARFDRCVTCHQGIDRTQPGHPAEPAFRSEQVLTVQLDTPEAKPEPEEDGEGPAVAPALEKVYGLVLAERGILDPHAATIQRILPKTRAADAKLLVGDVIERINDIGPIDRAAVRKYLLEEAEWGQPLELQIRRGLPQPYCSHPRQDLFVGSLSPHPMAEFGCTICHDGQGSATEFKWASHTPNDPRQRAGWRKDYAWFRNHDWGFPMLPSRFAESRCLKCHHKVTDLEPSRRFPEPPAPKLLAGYHLIRRSGCFGCHEIKGTGNTGAAVGPDMRLEPNDAKAAAEPHPGTMRKVGPSLRDLRSKVEAAFLTDWIRDPANFLPTARMPQFYGLHEHLEGRSLADAKRFEAVEIGATVAYLLAAGQPVEPLAAPAEVTEPPSAERGKRLFQIHGCLACHKHADFPEGRATQGPDLSRVGAKFTTEAGARWLASWIRDPVRHRPRTLMPDPLLEPTPLTTEETEAGPESRRMTDQAADITAYLLDCKPWRPKAPLPFEDSDLDELALLHLRETFPGRLAEKYLEEGIPESMAEQERGDAVELLGEITREKKLRYVGRSTIRRRGCYGCHDIPGFEDAPPIGPALSDWGRKQESLLAFGQIKRFIKAAVPAAAKQPNAARLAAAAEQPSTVRLPAAGRAANMIHRLAAAGRAAKVDNPDHGFYLEALLTHRREGFIWQKLRAPRSFDFMKAHNKAYDQWLTMPRFQFTEEEREAIITFVLGLVADPPAQEYVYHPDPRRKAIVAGRKVLDRYACAECHTLEMERWTFEFDPDQFESPPAAEDHDFLKPHISPEQMAASLKIDNRGLGRAEVVGMPQVDADGQLLVVDEDVDQNDNEIFMYGFALWESAAINGEVCAVGGADVLIWDHQITGRRPPRGGALARLLYPVVLAEARAAGSGATGPEAWGWVPPPLVHEGAKVQPAWLHDYLLEPTRIRPAAVLRMPRYNMSPAEAGKLVDYFAALSGVDFPYSSDPRARAGRLEGTERRQPGRLEGAMKILIDTQTYCAKCHLIGDYSPGGQVRTTLAPNLERAGRRLRPEYLRRWLANPRAMLPYTGMPVNFPPTGRPVDPERFPGNSLEQLDAVTHLLLNYDWQMKRRTSIRQLIQRQTELETTP